LDLRAGETMLIDKPLEWTSFQAVKKLKYATGIRKIKVGHAGTLDPLATGLLVICFGKATKTIESIQGQTKEYTGKFTIGATTPSFDLETEPENFTPYDQLSEDDISRAKQAFIGEIQQYPPIFSAVKIDGQRAYKAAREGKQVEVRPRFVTIDEFEITEINLPEISFRITCSKGTYIRSIANDFGKSLGTGAYLSSLRRTKIGDYDVKNALTVQDAADLLNKNQEHGGH
jgi:tRNA pseudouridine55 synthase